MIINLEKIFILFTQLDNVHALRLPLTSSLGAKGLVFVISFGVTKIKLLRRWMSLTSEPITRIN